MIYLDNAATSHPKPEEVYRAHDSFLRQGGSPGRSAHKPALDAARLIFQARLAVASLLGVARAERVIFTPGCTAAINMVLKGLEWNSGDVVVVSALEHNAVMRPLRQLQSRGVVVKRLAYLPGGIVDLPELRQCLAENRPRLCILQEASNVTGEMLDVSAAAEICLKSGVALVVDAAQSAGPFHEKIVEGVSFWCASGHKGLLGAPGAGVLYVAPGFELEPLVAGGTGSNSEHWEMPEMLPDRLESGTLPGPAIAAMKAGVEWIESAGREKLSAHERRLSGEFLSFAARLERVRVVTPACQRRTGVVSFAIEGIDCADAAGTLDREYGICVRAGLHCAASAHLALGTTVSGLVRASFGAFNSESDVEELCRAVERMAAG